MFTKTIAKLRVLGTKLLAILKRSAIGIKNALVVFGKGLGRALVKFGKGTVKHFKTAFQLLGDEIKMRWNEFTEAVRFEMGLAYEKALDKLNEVVEVILEEDGEETEVTE